MHWDAFFFFFCRHGSWEKMGGKKGEIGWSKRNEKHGNHGNKEKKKSCIKYKKKKYTQGQVIWTENIIKKHFTTKK